MNKRQSFLKNQTIWIISIIICSSFSVVYMAFPPDIRYQIHDSLNYAFSAELKGYQAIWPNHPLGHIVLTTALKIARMVGYEGKAFPLFQHVNGALAGISVALFFIILVKVLQLRLAPALAAAVMMGGSFCLWNYAGTGDIYSLTVVLILATWLVFLYQLFQKNSATLLLSGLVLGVAMLSHQLAVLFGIAALVLLFRERKGAQFCRSMITLGIGVVIAILAGYYLIGIKATGSLHLSTIVQWMRGYVGDSRWGGYWGLKIAGYGLLNFMKVFIYNSWNFNPQIITNPDDLIYSDGLPPISPWIGAIGMLLWLILLGGIFFAIARLKSIDSKLKSIFWAGLVQTFIGGILIIWWLPTHLRFWLLNAIPLLFVFAITFAVVFKEIFNKPFIHKKLLQALPIVFSFILLIYNFSTALLERSKKDPFLMEELQLWIDHSGRDDLLMTRSEELVQPLRYWGNRIKTRTLKSVIQQASREADTQKALRLTIESFLETDKDVFFDAGAIQDLSDQFLADNRITRESLNTLFLEFERRKEFDFSNPQTHQESEIWRLLKKK